jgi:hypothetical protein
MPSILPRIVTLAAALGTFAPAEIQNFSRGGSGSDLAVRSQRLPAAVT